MRTLLLIMTLVGLSACNSVKFSPVEPEQIASVVTPPPAIENPLCLEGETSWAVGGSTRVTCGTACWDGSSLQCEAALEKEMICLDNRIQETGRTRTGTVGNPVTSCPVQPAPVCLPGQNRWVAGPNGTANCPSACWDGSVLTCQTTTEKQQVCLNNAYSDNGQTRIASIGAPIGSCPVRPVYRDVTEDFVTPGPGKADILVILDTTISMDNDLNKLAPKLGSLTKHLKDVDWQVAITNSGVGNVWPYGHLYGKFMQFQKDNKKKRKIMTYKDSPDSYFQYTVGRDRTEVGEERCNFAPFCMMPRTEPMAALMMAIKERNDANVGFFRKDAWLIPLVISDADEAERGDHEATTPAEATGYFARQLGGVMKGMAAFGIVIKPGDKACLDENNAGIFNGGARYANLLTQFFHDTGGSSMSLCDKDYGPGLSEIGEKVRLKMSHIEIKQVPATTKIEVTVTPKTDATWKVEGTKIIFSKPLPANAKVQVKYQVKN